MENKHIMNFNGLVLQTVITTIIVQLPLIKTIIKLVIDQCVLLMIHII